MCSNGNGELIILYAIFQQDAIQKTASSAFGFFADHGESAATTYGVDAGYRVRYTSQILTVII